MQGVELLHRPAQVGRAGREELTHLAEHLSFTWPSLRPPSFRRWSEGQTLYLEELVPWLSAPAERDPLRGRHGGSVLPRQALARLKAIEGMGVPFQRVAIAHELDPRGPVGPLLPVLQAGPHICSDDVGRILVGEVPPHPWAVGLLAVLDWIVTGPRRWASRSPQPPSGLGRVVFGVVGLAPPRDGQLCLWYPVAEWRW